MANKIKLMTIIGTRPEIIRLSAVIKNCDVYFDQILVHTGQTYEYTLNQTYARDRVGFSAFLTQLREEMRKDTLAKIEEASNKD